MKSQKGSTTVIALIMLLFLVILCGGWIVMMTQEKTNALADAKQQQAWYAAEAGYKRAAVLLGKKETTWDWTTNSTSDVTAFNKGTFNRKVDLQTLTVNGSDLKDTTNNPWYAVHIDQITSDTYSSYPTSSGASQTYAITSVGEYMGERKIIKRSITITASSDGGSSTLVGPGLIQAGGKLTIDNNGSNVVTGDIYVANSDNYSDTRGDAKEKAATATGVHYGSAAVSALKTHVPDKYFETSNYNLTTVQYVDKVTGYDSAINSPLIVRTGTPILVNWPNIKARDYWGSTTPSYNKWSKQEIQGENDSLIFIHVTSGTNLRLDKGITGPSTGKPLTVVFDGDVTLDAELNGNIMILSKGTITIPSRNTISGMIFVVSNGDINWGPLVKYATLSSNNNVTILRSATYFYGQIVAKNNVNINGSKTIYDSAMVDSGWFSYPEGMTSD